MPISRTRKESLRYKKHLRTVDPATCAFCSIDTGDDQLVEESRHFKILHNLFPYSVWDGLKVTSHLLITPRQHTDSLSNMTDEQKVEYVSMIEAYETRGYNVYARAPGSASKSIHHQHTHLIQTEGRLKKLIFYMEKPYIRYIR